MQSGYSHCRLMCCHMHDPHPQQQELLIFWTRSGLHCSEVLRRPQLCIHTALHYLPVTVTPDCSGVTASLRQRHYPPVGASPRVCPATTARPARRLSPEAGHFPEPEHDLCCCCRRQRTAAGLRLLSAVLAGAPPCLHMAAGLFGGL